MWEQQPADNRIMAIWGVLLAIGVAVYLGSQLAVTLAYRGRRLQRRWPWSLDPEAPGWIGLANLFGMLLIIIASAKLSTTDEEQYLLLGGAAVICLLGRSAIRWVHNHLASAEQGVGQPR